LKPALLSCAIGTFRTNAYLHGLSEHPAGKEPRNFCWFSQLAHGNDYPSFSFEARKSVQNPTKAKRPRPLDVFAGL